MSRTDRNQKGGRKIYTKRQQKRLNGANTRPQHQKKQRHIKISMPNDDPLVGIQNPRNNKISRRTFRMLEYEMQPLRRMNK